MSGDRIFCCITGLEFKGTEDEAFAAGWELDFDGWVAPAPGWNRFPREPRAAISREFVAYDNGIDFDPVPLNFGGAR